MPEDKAIHPGSFVGDSVEEWKKLPTWGKVLAVAALAVVGFLAWRAHQAAGTTSTSAPSTGTTAGSQSPYPMINGMPVLPSNVNPLLDSSGQPYAYQQQPPGGNPSGPPFLPLPPIATPPQPPQPPNPPQPPPPADKWYAPLIPFGQTQALKGINYNAWGQKVTYNGITYTTGPGANGLLWGVPNFNGNFQQWNSTPIAPGQKVALYSTNQSSYQPPALHPGGAGGPTHGYMDNPYVYHQAATPHISSASPYGGL